MHKYVLVDQKTVGKGSYGAAKLYKRKSDNKLLIMKKMKIDEDAFCEAKMLQSLDCKYIVKYIDSFRDEDYFYIVMEYAEGGDLIKLLEKQNGKSSLHQRIKIINGLCEAIYYIHSRDIIHRDIKPSNIFLDQKGNVLLGDFGLSKILKGSNKTSTYCGTPYYMAPEVEKRQSYDKKADIYSIGFIWYLLCTQSFPSDNSDVDSISWSIIGSHKLKKLLKAMLSKDPNQRPSISEIKHAFDEYHRGIAEGFSLGLKLLFHGLVSEPF